MTHACILLVEDEAPARTLLARGLSRLGYRVTAVADGAEAIPLLHRPWDAIVTDLVMPRVDGLSLLEEARRRGLRAARVVITSFADKDKVIAALNLGAAYLLEKPFGIDRLAEIIRRLLADRREGADAMVHFFQQRLLGLPLASRERDLVAGLLKGSSNKELAARYGISQQTVKNILSGVYAKLGVTSRTELFHVVFPI